MSDDILEGKRGRARQWLAITLVVIVAAGGAVYDAVVGLFRRKRGE